jgi:urea transporter
VPTPVEWVKITLRGIGQVMFQDNALTGLLFLLGIFAADVEMGLGALVGAALGTFTGWVLRYDPVEVRDGIYGFNGTLVGIASLFYFSPTAPLLVLLIVGCAASSVVTWAARKYVPFPTYTAPFIVTTWVLIAIGHMLRIPEVAHPAPHESLNMTTALMGMTEGLGEVMFQASLITGIAFLVGLAVNDWRHAVLGLLGSVVGTLVAIYHRDLADTISIGIYGYNATLAAIALYLWRKSLLIPILGALISTPITEFFGSISKFLIWTELAALTAPFVLACWIVILVGAIERYFIGGWSATAHPETMASPPT